MIATQEIFSFKYSPSVNTSSIVSFNLLMDFPTFVICQILLHSIAKVESFEFKYHTVFNFGDSNSDTGGLAAGIAFPIGPPHGQTFFQKPAGRLCDGRLITDFLMDAMGLPFMNPYLDSVGAPNFKSGCNFATGGSTILPAKPNAISPFSLDIQVAQFIRFKARVLDVITKDKKLQEFVPSPDDFKQGVYMLDIGQNDIDRAFGYMSQDQVFALIPTILSQFRLRIQKLYGEGGRNFWIHNTGPLGCLPRIIATFGQNASKLDQFQCVDSHNQAAKLFNLQLQSLCAEFQQQFPEAKLTYVDVYTIKLNLIANYSQYGFKEGLGACCGYGGLPLNYDSRVMCGQSKVLNGSVVRGDACTNTTQYVNWDGNHYTEAANHYISSQILTGNYLHPSPLSLKPTSFFSLLTG
ncbi:GDSL esterase/lipase At1g54790-like [Salvia miltiorrhiza]|uniref:GDSL esterase/lipase At1g54790-like n=1 Tax=Salvia miltiorrhiza TaxID=226208 RepID=UPI0025ABDC41|nr:GDSL esterase/lipase At1g54790-like [Salvia miltiorrhiza]